MSFVPAMQRQLRRQWLWLAWRDAETNAGLGVAMLLEWMLS